MQDLEKATVEEEMALRDAKVKLDLGQYEGNTQRAADAAATRQKMINQGIQSTIKLGGMAATEFTPLFTKEEAAGTDMSALNFQQNFQGGNRTNLLGNSGYNSSVFNPQFQGLNYTPNLSLSNLNSQNPYMIGNTPYSGLNMYN